MQTATWLPGYGLLMNCARATVLTLAIGCAGDEAVGPARPTPEQRAQIAEVIDEAGGFEDYTIGRHLSEVVNVGAPSAKHYMPDGLALNVYRKSNLGVKVGDVVFSSMALYFGRTDELQMYRLTTETSAAECETAKVKLSEAFGMADPIGKGVYRWLGHTVFGTWQHTDVRGKPTCIIEFRATKMR